MTRPLLVIFLTIFVNLVGFGIIVPLLPFYAETFGASPLVVGMLFAVFSLCQLIASPILGPGGQAMGALSVAAPLSRVDEAVAAAQSAAVMRAAREIESRVNGEPASTARTRAVG